MKDIYSASLLHGGVLGGGICVKDDKIIYCTNKLTVEEKYRRLSMPFCGIAGIEKCGRLFPIVSVKMRNGDEHRFLIFRLKSFMEAVRKNNIPINAGETNEEKSEDNF